nr:MAG TPA: hypothetical protein [Caudoviricetes sp.]
MIINPYKMMRAYIDKETGMLKLYVPDIIKDNVQAEIDDYQLTITIQ